ncbi:MAG: hypothetical protein KDA68_06545 [Planctomycetaceae bacterium]|nr:hypothetical protein [Planctomycetaceae bacterium]
MSQASPSDNESSSSSGRSRKLSLDVICQAFQKELEEGRRPKIEKVLSQLKEKYHERVLRSLMMSEIGYRRRSGESPSQSHYAARFPAFEEVVEEVFEFLGPAPLGKPLPSALRSSGMVSMITSQSSLDFPIAVDESAGFELDDNSKPGDTTTDSKSRTNSGVRGSGGKAGGDSRAASSGKGSSGGSSSPARSPQSNRQKPPGQKSSSGAGSPQRKGSAQKPAAAKPSASRVEHIDDDLNSLLSVNIKKKPERKKSAEEIEEARERLERMKEKQRKKDRQKRFKVTVDEEEIAEASQEPMAHIGEFQLPLIITIASAILNLIVILMITQDQLPMGWFLLYKGIVLTFMFGATLMALFVAAYVLGTQYGYLHTAILKVAAICLTQSWIADLWYLVPLPVVYEAGCWFSTLVLFQLFFEIDTLDSIYSIIIINVTREITAIYLAVILMQIIANNPWIAEKAFEQIQQMNVDKEEEKAKVHNPQVVADAKDKAKKENDEVKDDPTADDVPEAPAPKRGADENDNPDDPAERPVLQKDFPEMTAALMKFSHRFANLIILEELEDAYELTSPEYQKKTSLADFKTLLLDVQNATGIPISSMEHIETSEVPAIQQRGIAHDVDTPEEDLLAITRITFKVDTKADEHGGAFGIVDDTEAILDLLLIKEDGKIRIREIRQGY